MTDNTEMQKYFESLQCRKLQTSKGFYNMFYCQFTRQNAKYPAVAWLKMFSTERLSEFHREQSMLIELKETYPDMAIPSYIYHYFDTSRHPCLFLSAFDSILENELSTRAKSSQYWSEPELWSHLTRLSEIIFTLHSRRIVHRNICPATVFLKGGNVYLGHFDDSKQIARGVTEQLQTLRGCVVYLSPQAYAGVRAQTFTTYEDGLKDDIWGLGLVLFSMATLNKQSSLNTFFTQSQQKFSDHIREQLRDRYSAEFAQIVVWLLMMNNDERPAADDLLEMLRETFSAVPCQTCRKWVYRFDRIHLECSHAYCDSCLTARVNSLSALPITCQCPLSTGIPFEYFSVIPEVQTKRVVRCSGCGKAHARLLAEDGAEQPYSCRCTCGVQFCSVSGKTEGHGDEIETCPQG